METDRQTQDRQPARKTDRQTDRLPASDAICSAVFPLAVEASTKAFLSNSISTISKWPSFEAKCKAFRPLAFDTLMLKEFTVKDRKNGSDRWHSIH